MEGSNFSNSNFSLQEQTSSTAQTVVGESARPEGLEKAVGYSDGFEQATAKFGLMIVASFSALTLNMVSASLLERDKKIPVISQEKSDKILPALKETGFWFGYASISIMFFIHTIGFGVVTQEVR